MESSHVRQPACPRVGESLVTGHLDGVLTVGGVHPALVLVHGSAVTVRHLDGHD